MPKMAITHIQKIAPGPPGDSDDIAGADGCSQRCTETLKLGDGFIIFLSVCGDMPV